MIARLLAPQWGGGWAGARVGFAVAALLTWLPRARGIGDAYGVADMVFSQGPLYLNDLVVLSTPTAWVVWGGCIAGLVMTLIGGRAAKPGVVLWLAAALLLLGNEAINIKAYDRLMLWIAAGLLLAPIGERGLTGKSVSPLPRGFLLVVFAALYGATGWLKILDAGGHWYRGEVLSNLLVHQHFGLRPLGVWVSGQAWLVRPMSWWTVAFEASFPLLIWWRRSNPWVLAAGLAMHAGIFVLMNVGPFSFVALAAYPILLHPDAAEAGWRKITRAA